MRAARCPDPSSPGTRDRPRRLIFLHLYKTGGMSLRGLFARNHRDGPHFNTGIDDLTAANWNACLERLVRHSREELERFVVFKGHMVFGLHRLLPFPIEYVTFLRDPVKRVVSHYRTVRRKGTVPESHRLDPRRADWGLPEDPVFLASLDNGQTRALAGLEPDLPLGACTAEHLARARANLERHFRFVGLMERFDLSLMLMRRHCGWGWRFYVPDNRAGCPEPPLDAAALGAIRELNRFDRELYAYAVERFREEEARGGWKLAAEERFFRLGNRGHQLLHAARHRLKRRLGLERRPEMIPATHEPSANVILGPPKGRTE